MQHQQHHDPAETAKHMKTYWLIGGALYVFTVITVAINQIHLAVPLAITLALIVASMKGTMVAAIFMHLNHEKKWIYGSLILTVVFFIVLMSLPVLTTNNNIGSPLHHAATGALQSEVAPAEEAHH